MNLIVAVDAEWGIGYQGDLLARIRADLMNFKALTLGKTVIYGSNTLATFPYGRPLKNRKNIVLNPSSDFIVEGATTAHSIDELLLTVKDDDPDELFVIGGASIYRQLLPYCNKAYVTKFEKVFPKDVSIPNLDESDEWKCISVGEQQLSDPSVDSEENLAFRFVLYQRVGNFTDRNTGCDK